MNAFAISGLLVAVMASSAALGLREEPRAVPTTKEHQWLQQLAGEWDGEVEAQLQPGQPPEKSKGTETIRGVGEYWVLSQIEGICPVTDAPFAGVLTLGFDAERGKFVGTWVDSMSSYFWEYEGTLDPARNALTLETEGPCPMAPDKQSKFREVIEFKSKDHKVFTTSVQGENGEWVTMMTCNSRRKK